MTAIIFFGILFGIKQLNKLKKTLKTIHQLSCFEGHPVHIQGSLQRPCKDDIKLFKYEFKVEISPLT